ncbi:MAG: response regulator [Mariniphaga sp.]
MKKYSSSNFLSLISVILLTLLCITILIIIRIRDTQKTEISIALNSLYDSQQPVKQVENTLDALFLAENQFREYTLNNEKSVFDNYRQQINQLTASIDTIGKTDALFNTPGKESKAITMIKNRDQEAAKFIRLKRLTDSLWMISAVIDSVPFKPLQINMELKSFVVSKATTTIDTLKQTTVSEPKKKGFFGKLKSLFKDESTSQTTTSSVVIKSQSQSEVTDSILSKKGGTPDLIAQTNTYYQNQLKKLLQNQNKLRRSELELIRMNYLILSEIKSILNSIRQTALLDRGQVLLQSSQSISSSSRKLTDLLLVAIIATLIFALLSVFMLRKNQKYQKSILLSQQKAIEEAAEKSRFLAYFSHEFRTPLSTVIGFAEQLEQTPLSADQGEFLSGMLSASEILLTTVNDILDLSKLQAGKMTYLNNPFNPEETISQIGKSMSKMAKDKNLALNITTTGLNVNISGDDIRLRQILNNLVNNAIKYTPTGSVTINATVEQQNETALLRICVADTGMGIAEDMIDSIFDEYSRVHDQSKNTWIIGTGLGLPVTKKLVEGMNGHINVSSQLGKGSEFTITIPFTITKELNSNLSDKNVEKLTLPSGIKILVADDNHLNAMLLSSILNRHQIRPDLAANGAEALEKITSGNYDLLLSDLYMPEMDGIELTKQIRNHANPSLRKLPIIILTGSISPETSGSMIEAGVNDYIYKPFKQKDLIELIRKHFQTV